MIKAILAAIWTASVAVGANYGYAWVKARRGESAIHEAKSSREVRKLKEISVPTIREGAVKGYIVVKLAYVVDASKQSSIDVAPDAFVADEAFSYLYSDETIDYNRLDRYDVAKFKATIIKRVNERLHADVVTDVALQGFNYMR